VAATAVDKATAPRMALGSRTWTMLLKASSVSGWLTRTGLESVPFFLWPWSFGLSVEPCSVMVGPGMEAGGLTLVRIGGSSISLWGSAP